MLRISHRESETVLPDAGTRMDHHTIANMRVAHTCIRAYVAVLADSAPLADAGIAADDGVATNLRSGADHGTRLDGDILAELCRLMHDSAWMDEALLAEHVFAAKLFGIKGLRGQRIGAVGLLRQQQRHPFRRALRKFRMNETCASLCRLKGGQIFPVVEKADLRGAGRIKRRDILDETFRIDIRRQRCPRPAGEFTQRHRFFQREETRVRHCFSYPGRSPPLTNSLRRIHWPLAFCIACISASVSGFTSTVGNRSLRRFSTSAEMSMSAPPARTTA